MMEAAPGNGTVLIVDDTPGNLALLSDTLSEANYRVLVATDGVSALEQIQYVKPDIILLDVMMPGIDGFETCARLKADPATAAIPVLFMTGLSELENLLRGFGEGALDYIVKPIRPPEVLARIEVHLTQTRNLLRAEQLLNHGEFAALAVDAGAKSIGGRGWRAMAGGLQRISGIGCSARRRQHVTGGHAGLVSALVAPIRPQRGRLGTAPSGAGICRHGQRLRTTRRISAAVAARRCAVESGDASRKVEADFSRSRNSDVDRPRQNQQRDRHHPGDQSAYRQQAFGTYLREARRFHAGGSSGGGDAGRLSF